MKRIFVSVLLLGAMSSCVSSKVYNDLQSRYDALKGEKQALLEENQSLDSSNNDLENQLNSLQDQYDTLLAERNQLRQDYDAAQNNLENLKASYEALEKNSSAAIRANVDKNKALLEQLESKERLLAKERSSLEALKKQLDSRSKRVDELESLIAAKDQAMKKLKDAISSALLDFEGKGLTVEQRDGKVYVSMENKLLFQSGSWAVNETGRRAVQQLGSVLVKNPDINVLIEEHNDNVPYRGNGPLQDN